jgi:hypothetical protein
VPATFDSALYDCVHHDAIGDANYVLHGALWGANCNTLYAASKLSMYSECLKYMPEDVREQFLSLVADAVVATTIIAEIAAQQAAAEYGKYSDLLFMSLAIVQHSLFSACCKQTVCFSCMNVEWKFVDLCKLLTTIALCISIIKAELHNMILFTAY